MSRSSASRIAKRAAKFDQPLFVMPPSGLLSEQVDLPEFELVLGLQHPEDGPLMIAAWDGQRLRRLMPEQASKWVDELIASGQAEALAPVIEALRRLVRRVGEIVTASIMRTVH